MEKGIILTTGDAILAIGPNNDPLASSDNSLPGHPLLTQLYGTYSRDACGLDFNFMSNNDLLICKTIFGSEEYPGYINIDEGFGIFISGSKPEGGNYADTNIANIPNTCIPINVNNINNVIPSFPEYYVDNTNGQYIQYNGFTVVIEVYIYLFPDSTYNAKILTADLADRYYDSGVFIEKNSFKSVSSTELLSFNFQALINPGLSEDYTGIIINDSVFVSLPFPNPIVYTGIFIFFICDSNEDKVILLPGPFPFEFSSFPSVRTITIFNPFLSLTSFNPVNIESYKAVPPFALI